MTYLHMFPRQMREIQFQFQRKLSYNLSNANQYIIIKALSIGISCVPIVLVQFIHILNHFLDHNDFIEVIEL